MYIMNTNLKDMPHLPTLNAAFLDHALQFPLFSLILPFSSEEKTAKFTLANYLALVKSIFMHETSVY